MKTSQSIALAAFAALNSAAAVLAGGPYDAQYETYCGNGKTEGTIDVDGDTWAYYCDYGHTVVNFQHHNVRDAAACADYCELNGPCDMAVWDKKKGECWTGTPQGDKVSIPGRMYMTNDANSQLASCQASLKKWGPAAPNCSNDRKPTEVDGQKFLMTCGLDSDNNSLWGQTDTIEDCMKQCAKDSSCTYVEHKPSNNNCWLGTANFFALTDIKTSNNHNTAVKID